jgi:hypothetical protein
MTLPSEQVREIAEQFVAAQDNKGFTLKFVSAKKNDRGPGNWSAIFDVFTPQGSLLDGPVVVIVNEESKQAHYL